MAEEKKKGPSAILTENLRTLRKRPIPPDLLKRINERAQKNDELEEQESIPKKKIAKPAKKEAEL